MHSAAGPARTALDETPRELIVFQIGTQEFCVDINSVKEIRGETPATLLPQSPSYLRGVINLRGAILPIVDMSERLHLPSTGTAADKVVVIVWIGKKLVGLLVDAVSDIVAVTEDALQISPNLMCETVGALVEALVTVENRMIGLLALDRILPGIGGEIA